jgi:hypothetical protein
MVAIRPPEVVDEFREQTACPFQKFVRDDIASFPAARSQYSSTLISLGFSALPCAPCLFSKFIRDLREGALPQMEVAGRAEKSDEIKSDEY